MICADFNRLVELVEGTLDREQAEATRLHLQECEGCRKLLAAADREETTPSGAVPVPFEVGERIGRYEVTGWLGAGGMGIVLRAHDPDLDRDVALKVFASLDARDVLLREARHAAKISHPNVVGVFDAGVDGRRGFIAMELVVGESLARWRLAAPRRTGEIVDLFTKAGEGLVAAHRAGLVHGDFKPENILVGTHGTVKVVDFGLSRAIATDGDHARGAGPPGRSFAGTPRYMAHELWLGHRPTARSDQFSFAVALSEALIGAVGQTRSAADAALVRAMSPDPSARFASMDELLDALRGGARSGSRRRTLRWTLTLMLASTLGVAVSMAHALRPAPVIANATVAPAEDDRRDASADAVDAVRPDTVSHEAAEAYRAALVAHHDASADAALRSMRRALALDPDFAAAHLRYALYGDIPLQERRQHVERASQLRTRLTEPERALLGALESFVQLSRASYVEYVTKLTDAARRFPSDAEIALESALARARLELPPAGTDVTQAALALDPTFAQAHLGEAEIAIWQADRAHAERALARCVAVSPSATSCMRLDAVVHGLAGECEAMKSRALAMVNADPESDRAYGLLAMALASTGAPMEAVREALRTREALFGPGSGPVPKLRDEAELASFDGDFATADARLRDIDALPDVEYAGMAHEAAFERILLDEETGQGDKAVAIAEAYVKRFAGWPHGFWGRARPVALATLHRAGKVPDAEFLADQRAWAEEERDKNLPIEQGLAWVDFYARMTRTRAEAQSALALLPQSLPLPNPKGLHWNNDPVYLLHREGIGRTYLLGDRPAEAAESLSLVARSCMGLEEPWAYVQAHLELAEARESLGDVPGACSAYADVLARWGRARPRSITAEAARRRTIALACH